MVLRALCLLDIADGTGAVNWEGVTYYNKLIDNLIAQGKLIQDRAASRTTNLFSVFHPQAIYNTHLDTPCFNLSVSHVS